MNLPVSLKHHTTFLAFVLSAILFLAIRLGFSVLPDSGDRWPSLTILPFKPSRENHIATSSQELLQGLGREVPLASAYFKNLFQEWQAPPMVDVVLKLDSVIVEGPPVFFQGLMQDDDGSYVAQINLDGRSFFLSAGESAHGWTMNEVSPEAVQVTDPKGKKIAYPYRGGDDLKKRQYFAVIIKEPGKQTFRVKPGDSFENLQVVGIEEDSVALEKDGERLSLKKGGTGLIIDRMEAES